MRGVEGWPRVGSRVGPRVGPLQTSCSGVFPGPNYALQFPVLTETRETGGASGRFAHRIQGKEGVGGGPRSGSVRGVEFLGGPGKDRRTSTLPVVGEGQGNPWRQGDPEKKTTSSGKGLAGRWSLCRVLDPRQ